MFDFLFRNKKAEKAELPFKTDIHNHIIPGVDDGSRDLQSSIFLVEKLIEMGINKIIATPHRTDETFENTVDIIEPKLTLLNSALKENSINIDITYSFEYRMDEGFIELKNKGLLRPLIDNYILVENSFIQPLRNLDDLIFDLKLKGFFPILAHPERYNYYHTNKNIYRHLKSQEVLFQLNILSLSGCYGEDVQKTSIWLLKNNMIEFMGTDVHHKNHIIRLEQFLKSSQYKKLLPLFEDIRNDDI